MDITVTSFLNPAQKTEIQCIVTASREKESIRLSFPLEDADLYVLLSLNGHIYSAAAFTTEGENSYECAAFTDPDHRRLGLFASVLEAGLSALPEEAELLFYTEPGCRDAGEVLYTLGAEHLFDEHMMELLPGMCTLPPALLYSGTHDLLVVENDSGGNKTLSFSNAYGSVNITVFPSHYYLYGFRIREDKRKRGHGKELLGCVLRALAERKELPVTLQVAGDNLPALSFYKRTGFRITETLSCFLY